ncbi:hypothetical protein [uncultured Cohaesibacter sp.]|uniref:hypothetical protein n=1 Tax=uncultured Cohaesibacter sp. TaxID=1002546 RepID=UPI0029C7C3B6|nr:hypothetical protein [uncultured Cohaesibacter sp.]
MADIAPVFNDYVYSGPVQSICLKSKNVDGDLVTFLDDILNPGRTYSLLEGHRVVEGWKAMKLVTRAAREGADHE